MLILLILSLLLLSGVVIFIFQNPNPVVVHFLMWQFEGSLALLLLLTFIFGIITCLLTAIPLMLRRKTKNLSDKQKEEMQNQS
ncbi:MAG: LapA family protein [Candidatus Levybacteria bacterium]|nr:LapA family protein [Candidatus Levybacteria bacterium]